MSIKNFVSTSVTLIHIKVSVLKTLEQILSSFTMSQSHFCCLIIIIFHVRQVEKHVGNVERFSFNDFSYLHTRPAFITNQSRVWHNLSRLAISSSKTEYIFGAPFGENADCFRLICHSLFEWSQFCSRLSHERSNSVPRFSFSTKFSNQATKQYPCIMLFSNFQNSVLHFELYARAVQFRAKISFERAIFVSFYVRLAILKKRIIVCK